MDTTKSNLVDLFVKFRKAILEVLIDKRTDELNFPTDKQILHALTSVSYSIAKDVDYPFENVLIAHLTTLVPDRNVLVAMIDDIYKLDKELKANTSRVAS